MLYLGRTMYKRLWACPALYLCKYQLKPTQPEGTHLYILVNLNRTHDKKGLSVEGQPSACQQVEGGCPLVNKFEKVPAGHGQFRGSQSEQV